MGLGFVGAAGANYRNETVSSDTPSGRRCSGAGVSMPPPYAGCGIVSDVSLDEPFTLGQVVGLLESIYPPDTAMDWDQVGLVAGDLEQPVRVVHFAVDPTLALQTLVTGLSD